MRYSTKLINNKHYVFTHDNRGNIFDTGHHFDTENDVKAFIKQDKDKRNLIEIDTKMEKKSISMKTKQIRNAFMALTVLNDIKTENYMDTLFDMCFQDEKEYRASRPAEYELSLRDAAKLFAVKYIARSLVEEPLQVQEFLFIRHSRFFAASLVENYRDLIVKALEEFNIEEIIALDYVVKHEGDKS